MKSEDAEADKEADDIAMATAGACAEPGAEVAVAVPPPLSSLIMFFELCDYAIEFPSHILILGFENQTEKLVTQDWENLTASPSCLFRSGSAIRSIPQT